MYQKRKNLRKHTRILSKSRFNKPNLDKYNKANAAYKRTCRKAEKESRKALKLKLLKIGMSDPKQCWSIITKMNNWEKEHSEETEYIKSSTYEYLMNTLKGS